MEREGRKVSNYIVRTFSCDRCGEIHNANDAHTIDGGHTYCSYCADEHAVYCERCSNLVAIEDYNFDVSMCVSCYEEMDEAASY